MSTLPPQPAPFLPTAAAPLRQAVVITDIDMPFGSMVRFIVKWVVASIPALIILWVLLALFSGLGFFLVHTLFNHPHGGTRF